MTTACEYITVHWQRFQHDAGIYFSAALEATVFSPVLKHASLPQNETFREQITHAPCSTQKLNSKAIKHKLVQLNKHVFCSYSFFLQFINFQDIFLYNITESLQDLMTLTLALVTEWYSTYADMRAHGLVNVKLCLFATTVLFDAYMLHFALIHKQDLK